MKFVNTKKFSEAAAYYEKHGVYTKLPKGTSAYKDFWKEQAKRSLHGYEVDGVRITGYHYFYLNFCPIRRTVKEGEEVKYAGQGKTVGFPGFWDGDYEYFKAIEFCEDNGLHLPVLKARGKGFSYKTASMANRDYYLIKESVSYFLAYEKEFLIKDGVLTKCWGYMDFIDANTAWTKRRQVKNDIMHKRASYQNVGEEIERGYKSEIIGVAVKDDPDKARGKRTGTKGKIYIEEAGRFPDLLPMFEILRPSVEQGSIVTANIIVFGTGGTQGTGFEGLMELFTNPASYNCYRVKNTWEEGMEETYCGFFVPDWKNLDGEQYEEDEFGKKTLILKPNGEKYKFMDDDGNSDKELAMEFEATMQAKAKTSTDPSAFDRRKAEHPHVPSDAALMASVSMFPKVVLSAWKQTLIANPKLRDLPTPGTLEWNLQFNRWHFKPNRDLKPINSYPHKGSDNLNGAIVQMQAPYSIGDKIPDNLYIICVDPYAFTSSSDNESLGAAYVLKNINPYSRPDDLIVAWYVGRPKEGVDKFNEVVAQLAEYYNAKVGFESDRGEAFLSYFKHNDKLHLLAEEFQLGYNSNIPKSSVKREYGMHIGSGKNNTRKIEGNRYILKWLMKERGLDSNGKPILNLHRIYDIGLIDELMKYNDEGNFDRVSALRIGMYHMMELSWKESKKDRRRKTPTNAKQVKALNKARFQ